MKTIDALKHSSYLTIYFFAFCVLAGVWSCGGDDCGECFTPPSPFTFKMVDKVSGEDLFANETYSLQTIKIIEADSNPQKSVSFSVSEDAINVFISTNAFGWQTERVNYAIIVNGQERFRLFVDADRVVENCCSFTRINELRIDGAEFKYDGLVEEYTIFITN